MRNKEDKMKRKFIVAVVALLFGGLAFANESQVDLGESSISESQNSLESPESSGETIEIEVGESQKLPESNKSTQNDNAESPTLTELVEDIYFENDGGFVGVDLGYSMIAWQSDYGRYEKDATTQYTQKKQKYLWRELWDCDWL